MCGILGIGGARGADLVGRLLPDLHHRGPDGQGVWSSPELTLGHRRLAIIGLGSEGEQPMWSRSGDSVIVFNGEIYNYLELADRLDPAGTRIDRRFDTAVLLEALETWGPDALPKLNGMFAFAWYRPGPRRLMLARDRFGKKPLFYGHVRLDDGSRVLAFSSELRTFSKLPGGPPPPDPLGVARYLVYDGLPGRSTIHQGVSKVLAASYVDLSLDGATIEPAPYWELRPHVDRAIDAAPVEAVEEALRRSLCLRLRSDVPVGLFLSGGLDSSLLAATWRALRPQDRLRTFTVGFEDPSFDERASARLMADAVGAEHTEVVLTEAEVEAEIAAVVDRLSEPFADPSIVPVSLLCRLARRDVTVAIGGDGSDELQAGYDPFRAWNLARAMESVLPRRFWHKATRIAEQLLPADPSNMAAAFKVRHFGQGFLHPPEERIQGWLASFPAPLALEIMRPELVAGLSVEEVVAPTRDAYALLLPAGELHGQIAVWIKTYLEASILAKVDRASMWHSLEVRAPFLDPDMADLLLSLPPRFIFHRGQGKRTLRAVARRRLPGALLSKPKKGFGIPLARWLRTVLRERMEDALGRTRELPWLRREPLEAMWREHLAGRRDHRKALWSFLVSVPFQR